MDWLQEHWVTVVGVVVIVAVLRAIARAWKSEVKAHRANVATAFCLHCNWEGRIDRLHPTCRRCGSHQMSVIVA